MPRSVAPGAWRPQSPLPQAREVAILTGMEPPRCEGCQQVLAEVKALRDEIAALRGWLAQDHASRRPSLRRWLRRLLIAYAIFMLYLLGVGPAVLLADKNEAAGDIVDVLYAPLELLCEWVPPLEPPLAAYISLWSRADAKE